jgi:hypothetical protein
MVVRLILFVAVDYIAGLPIQEWRTRPVGDFDPKEHFG